MTPKEILKAARAILSKPERWTQKAFARDFAGRVVTSPFEPSAVCFCAVGAIRRAAGRDRPYGDALSILAKAKRDDRRIANYNDAPRRTHKQILNWFDRAIAKA